jgi:hypothetical protein
MKRTYRIVGGRAELDAPARQEVLHRAEIPYDKKRKPPLRSPPLVTRDNLAFRARTDVVIQAAAYGYDPKVTRTVARVRFGKHAREIAVYGERRGDVDALGRPCFSDPGPVDVVPVRYDFAYGGVDLHALLRHGDPIADTMRPEGPDDPHPLFDTAYHYPRNPCGLGYVMEIDAATWKGSPLPLLEHPADPLTPERMAVGKPERWMNAPLPAGWDWQSHHWFPRVGYLGLTAPYEKRDEPPAEVARGWAARDILSIAPFFHDPEGTPRLEFMQGASPGMSVEEVLPGTTFELENLHPRKPRWSFRLPDEVPRARMEIEAGKLSDLASHLDSVVVRPGRGEVVMTWSARAMVDRELTWAEIAAMRREVAWVRAERTA